MKMSWGLIQSSPERVPVSEDCKILLAAVFVCLFSHYLYLRSWNTFWPWAPKGAVMLDSSSQMKNRQKVGSWCNIHICLTQVPHTNYQIHHAGHTHKLPDTSRRSHTQTTRYITQVTHTNYQIHHAGHTHKLPDTSRRSHTQTTRYITQVTHTNYQIHHAGHTHKLPDTSRRSHT